MNEAEKFDTVLRKILAVSREEFSPYVKSPKFRRALAPEGSRPCGNWVDRDQK
jgi:hypothetical protein